MAQALDDPKMVAESRKDLPIWSYRVPLNEIIAREEIFVLVGPTGSGKTTQLPQWCYEYIQSLDGMVVFK